MSIEWQVLGRPGADNAVLATVDTGQSVHPLLFDCGARVLDQLRIGEIQAIEQLCFSHFHMDHVCGFDTFFRHNYNRPDTPVTVWGPVETRAILHHRFRSFSWNLHGRQPGEWIVHEVTDDRVLSSRFHTREAFERARELPPRPRERDLLVTPAYRIQAISLPHHTLDTLGYRVEEAERVNVDPDALQASGLVPGPWLQALIDSGVSDEACVKVSGESRRLGPLRRELLVRSRGDSLAVLTDFRVEPDTPEWTSLVEWLADTDTLICECQYRRADRKLAVRNGHMTTDAVGRLAREADVSELILQHLSRRYEVADWLEMRAEARKEFPGTQFPPRWNLKPR